MGNQSVGGIWVKRAKNGKEYFSISIGDQRYVAFPNDKKEGKQPDYRILESDYTKQDYPKPQEPPQPSPLDSDIPF